MISGKSKRAEEEPQKPQKQFIQCCHCRRSVEVDRRNRADLFCWGCKKMATPAGGEMLDGELGSLAFKLIMLTAAGKVDRLKAIELFNRAKANPAVCGGLLKRSAAALEGGPIKTDDAVLNDRRQELAKQAEGLRDD